MALSEWLNHLQNLWPISVFRADDLKLSDRLVRRLSIPEETKQFVFAIHDRETGNTIYVLCAQNLSERSARDSEVLIREVRPEAVLVQVGSQLPDFKVQEGGIGDGDGEDYPVPISAFSVLKRCFVEKRSKDEYEGIAGGLILKEIFGVGMYAHLHTAKRVSEEIGSSFLLLEAPLVSPEGADEDDGEFESPSRTGFGDSNFHGFGFQPTGSALRNLGGGVTSNKPKGFFPVSSNQLQMLRSFSSQFDLSLSAAGSSGPSSEPRTDYQPPAFAQSVYPLLTDLHDIFSDVPSIGRALAYSQKMFDDLGRGKCIDAQVLSEVFTFQIAVEGLRVALNGSGRGALSKTGNLQFSELPVEEKSSCLLSKALQNQTKKFKTTVAVIDAGGLAGVRKYWNAPVPPEITNMMDEFIAEDDDDSGKSTNGQRRALLKDKPVVALGAGATAVLGASSLSKALPASTAMKMITMKVPASLKLFLTHTYKAAMTLTKSGASAGKIRAVTHTMIASAEKTSLSAMKTSFYEIMRKRRVSRVGVLPWAGFGCSIATCAGLVAYGDGIECAVESLPDAPAIASLGRGIRSLQEASQAVSQSSRTKIQQGVESLMYRLRKVRVQ